MAVRVVMESWSDAMLFPSSVYSVETKEYFCNRAVMLRAVIFDFNGIIVDDEPIHFALFRRVLGEEGITLTEEAYYERYLGFDDRGAFITGLREDNRPISDAKLTELIRRKANYYQDAIRDHVAIFPGVKSLLAELSRAAARRRFRRAAPRDRNDFDRGRAA